MRKEPEDKILTVTLSIAAVLGILIISIILFNLAESHRESHMFANVKQMTPDQKPVLLASPFRNWDRSLTITPGTNCTLTVSPFSPGSKVILGNVTYLSDGKKWNLQKK